VSRDGKPALEHPVLRQRLGEIAGYVATQEWAVARMLTAFHQGRDMEVLSELLTTKLFGTNLQQMIAKLALELIPDQGLREPDPDEATMSLRGFTRGRWVSQYMFTLAYAIAGGASNVQRNIIGEIVLGLPRDQRPGDRKRQPTGSNPTAQGQRVAPHLDVLPNRASRVTTGRWWTAAPGRSVRRCPRPDQHDPRRRARCSCDCRGSCQNTVSSSRSARRTPSLWP
jgi:hypothetical protein